MAAGTEPRNTEERKPSSYPSYTEVEEIVRGLKAITAHIDVLAIASSTGDIGTLNTGNLSAALLDLEERLSEAVHDLSAVERSMAAAQVSSAQSRKAQQQAPAAAEPRDDTVQNELSDIAFTFWNLRAVAVNSDDKNWEHMCQAIIAMSSKGGAGADRLLNKLGFRMCIGSFEDWMIPERLASTDTRG